jgi:hypothetical protein
MKKIFTQRGYTLLFAVLTATVVLGVTIFILSVSRKQFALSATARDSMSAFYSADAGIECAALTASTIDLTKSAPGTINCNGQNVEIYQGYGINGFPFLVPAEFDTTKPIYMSPGPNHAGDRIYLSLKREDGTTIYGCVIFTIYQGTDATSGNTRTVIESRGYNLCNDATKSADVTSSRTVERALQLIRK